MRPGRHADPSPARSDPVAAAAGAGFGPKSLWQHRLRSLLTVLGIVFGVCSVIAMLAIGEGASFEAQEQIKNLGSQNIILRSIKPPEEQRVSDKGSQGYVLAYGLKYIDLKRIRSTIPGVTIVVPGRIMREYVWNITRRIDCEILGTVPWYPEMRNHHVAQGRFFTDLEMESKASVCVLPAEMVPSLFPLDSPLGRDVRIGESYYRVIGVMEPRGKASRDLRRRVRGHGAEPRVRPARNGQDPLRRNPRPRTARQHGSGTRRAPRGHRQGRTPRAGDRSVPSHPGAHGPQSQEEGLRDGGSPRTAQTRRTDQTDFQRRARVHRRHLAPGRAASAS